MAAGGIRDATTFAAIQLYSWPPVPHSAIHVYRVRLKAFHVGPAAVVEELQKRVTTGGELRQLVGEYWEPTGVWHLSELLAPWFSVIEEVPAALEREIYMPMWVSYCKDQERAQVL